MAHEDETPYRDRVASYLAATYGAENVETNKYLADPYRFCDIYVEGPLVDLAIEVESRFSSAIDGVGQAFIYASAAGNAVPVVVVPPGHVEEPEIDALRDRIPVVEVDV